MARIVKRPAWTGGAYVLEGRNLGGDRVGRCALQGAGAVGGRPGDLDQGVQAELVPDVLLAKETMAAGDETAVRIEAKTEAGTDAPVRRDACWYAPDVTEWEANAIEQILFDPWPTASLAAELDFARKMNNVSPEALVRAGVLTESKARIPDEPEQAVGGGTVQRRRRLTCESTTS